MEQLMKLYDAYTVAKFWVIVGLISLGSLIVLPEALSKTSDIRTPIDGLFQILTILIAFFGLSLPVFAWWHHHARTKFLEWIGSEWSNLESGVKHPDGYMVALDTPLVRYEVVFSALLATVSFSSRPYVLQDRSAGFAQASFTLVSAVFGWWFFGLDGVVNTCKAIIGNMRNAQTFTLREMLSEHTE